MSGRVRYNHYSDEVRQRVRQAFEEEEDWLNIATLLGVKRPTVYRWVDAWEGGLDVPRRNRTRKRALNEAQIDELVSWVENDSTVTLSALQMRISAEFAKEVSLTTVARYLDGRLLTLKKLHPFSETMNSSENKRLRRKYVLDVMQYEAEGKTIIWLDETNFNLFCCRTRGRSLRGKRARVVMANSRGKNLHIIGAVSHVGLVGFTTRTGSYTSECCNQWVRDLLISLHARGITEPVVVCDNAPCHSRLESVFAEHPFENALLLRLAPYSPVLNPMESMFMTF